MRVFFTFLNYGLRFLPTRPDKMETVPIHRTMRQAHSNNYEMTCNRFLSTAAKSLQLCLTLCDPIDGNPPGSPIPGILQAKILEWVAISFSNAWKWKVKVKSLSRVRLLATPWTTAYQAPLSMEFSRQEYQSGVPLPSPFLPTNISISKLIWPCLTVLLSHQDKHTHTHTHTILCIYSWETGTLWLGWSYSGTGGKEPACQCRRHKRHRFNPWARKIPWVGNGNPLQ